MPKKTTKKKPIVRAKEKAKKNSNKLVDTIQKYSPPIIIITAIAILLAIVAGSSLLSSIKIPVNVKELANKYTNALVVCNYDDFVDAQGFSEETYEKFYGSKSRTAKDKFNASCNQFSKLEYLEADVDPKRDESSSSYYDSSYYVYYRITSEDDNNYKVFKLNVADRISDGKTIVVPILSNIITQEEFENR